MYNNTQQVHQPQVSEQMNQPPQMNQQPQINLQPQMNQKQQINQQHKINKHPSQIILQPLVNQHMQHNNLSLQSFQQKSHINETPHFSWQQPQINQQPLINKQPHMNLMNQQQPSQIILQSQIDQDMQHISLPININQQQPQIYQQPRLNEQPQLNQQLQMFQQPQMNQEQQMNQQLQMNLKPQMNLQLQINDQLQPCQQTQVTHIQRPAITRGYAHADSHPSTFRNSPYTYPQKASCTKDCSSVSSGTPATMYPITLTSPKACPQGQIKSKRGTMANMSPVSSPAGSDGPSQAFHLYTRSEEQSAAVHQAKPVCANSAGQNDLDSANTIATGECIKLQYNQDTQEFLVLNKVKPCIIYLSLDKAYVIINSKFNSEFEFKFMHTNIS